MSPDSTTPESRRARRRRRSASDTPASGTAVEPYGAESSSAERALLPADSAQIRLDDVEVLTAENAPTSGEDRSNIQAEAAPGVVAVDTTLDPAPGTSSIGTARPVASASKLNAGDELEMRLARVWYWEGSFTRRGINLQEHFTEENLTITDLDLLAIEVTGQLGSRRAIGEAKSGVGRDTPKPLDRCLWLAGVAQLVGAHHADYVTALPVSRRIRETASRLSVRPMTTAELGQRERACRVDEVADVGSHGPTAMAKAKFAFKHAKNDKQWERAFWFVRCEVWFLDPWHALKRTVGLLDSLANWWTPSIDDDDQSLLRWLYAEALGVFALNAVLLAGQRLSADKKEWRNWAYERFAEGAVPMHQMRVFASAIDRYVAGLLGRLDAPPEIHAESMGSFLPVPPEWTESLIELIERIASDTTVARELPRHVDLVVHERLVHRRHVDRMVLDRVDRGRGEDLDRLRRQLTAFLRGNARLPEAVDKALATATRF